MEVNVDIKKEDIEKHLVEAIINSSLGEELKNVCDDALKDLTGFNSPLKRSIEKTVGNVIDNFVRTTYKEVIEAEVKKCMTEEVVADIARKAWEKLSSNY